MQNTMRFLPRLDKWLQCQIVQCLNRTRAKSSAPNRSCPKLCRVRSPPLLETFKPSFPENMANLFRDATAQQHWLRLLLSAVEFVKYLLNAVEVPAKDRVRTLQGVTV